MQPRRPHGQRAPSSLTTTCPSSPADARPFHSLPSSTIPPPTPVPQNTPISDEYGAPAPSSYSASVATLTSLPSAIGTPSSSPSAPRTSTLPSQSGRLRALVTVPAWLSTSPGDPIPSRPSF